jgi:hypothetical protein
VAVQNILDPDEPIDGWTQRITPAQIDPLIPRISHNAEPDAIRVLTLAHECRVEIDEPAAKRRNNVDRAGMSRTARQFLPKAGTGARRRGRCGNPRIEKGVLSLDPQPGSVESSARFDSTRAASLKIGPGRNLRRSERFENDEVSKRVLKRGHIDHES